MTEEADFTPDDVHLIHRSETVVPASTEITEVFDPTRDPEFTVMVDLHNELRRHAINNDVAFTPDGITVKLTPTKARALTGLLTSTRGAETGPPVHLLLDLWHSLGGSDETFHPWWAEAPSFPDRWCQLVAALDGNIAGLAADTNPPAGYLLDLAVGYRAQGGGA